MTRLISFTIRPFCVAVLVAAALQILFPRVTEAQSPVGLYPPDVTGFPVIQLVVRPTDGNGKLVTGLQPDQFRIDESTDAAARTGIQPEVQTLAGGPAIGLSIVLDTRNGASREELNAVRDYARNVVTFVQAVPGEGFWQGKDLIEIWSPGVENTPIVNYGSNPVDYINAINTTLPYEGTSQGLDRLLSELITRNPPGNLPHVVLVVGKVADINAELDATVVGNQAARAGVMIYAANVGTDPVARDYLKSLALTTGGRYLEGEQTGGSTFVQELQDRFKGQYLLTYRSGLTPYPPYHTLVTRITAPSISGEASASVEIPTESLPGTVTTARIWIVGIVGFALLTFLALLRAAHCAGARLQRRAAV